MSGIAKEELRRRIDDLSAERAWLLADIRNVSRHAQAITHESDTAPPVPERQTLSLQVSTPGSTKQTADSDEDLPHDGFGKIPSFRPKKGIFTEPRIMGLAGMMMFFLLPFLTNQNGITASNSPDVTSYLVALRDFWTSIFRGGILR